MANHQMNQTLDEVFNSSRQEVDSHDSYMRDRMFEHGLNTREKIEAEGLGDHSDFCHFIEWLKKKDPNSVFWKIDESLYAKGTYNEITVWRAIQEVTLKVLKEVGT